MLNFSQGIFVFLKIFNIFLKENLVGACHARVIGGHPRILYVVLIRMFGHQTLHFQVAFERFRCPIRDGVANVPSALLV
jgi:hypothetical protein